MATKVSAVTRQLVGLKLRTYNGENHGLSFYLELCRSRDLDNANCSNATCCIALLRELTNLIN